MNTQPNPFPSDYLLDVGDMARLLKVSKRTIYRWTAAKRLPEPIRCGRNCLRWRASTIDRYLRKLTARRRKKKQKSKNKSQTNSNHQNQKSSTRRPMTNDE